MAALGGVLARIQRVACEERLYRLVHNALGEPQSEEEDYTEVVKMVLDKYESAREAKRNTGCGDGEVFSTFLAAAQEEFEDAFEVDTLNEFFRVAHGHLQADLSGLVKQGAERLMMEEEARLRSAAAAAQEQRDKQRTEAELDEERRKQIKFTADEKFHLQTLVRMGIEDESALANIQEEEQEEEHVEVEVNEELPEFLKGIAPRKQRMNFYLTAQQREERQRDRNREEEKQSGLEATAAKQVVLNKERAALRRRERARQAQRDEVVVEDAGLRSEFLNRDIDEKAATEEEGIKSAADLQSRRQQPWLEAQLAGDRRFGKKSDLTVREQQNKLPITEKKALIMEHLQANQTTILVGETGSGKTTQIPQYINELVGKYGIVGCTQPRRVAAVSLAERVAVEYGCRVGEEVGYSVRFKEMTSSLTRIKYMTDGMLLREALLDDTFQRYSCIILDEAHERSICTDVLFGILSNAVKKRPSLKLVVTSATLDTERFCKFFSVPEPLLIRGRTYPVDEIFENEPVEDYVELALSKVMEIHLTEDEGDILVFFTGQDEIETAGERLFNWLQELKNVAKLHILPLYATLPSEVQSKVFEDTPEGERKVVLATNVAETSITIPNLYYVIDPGFCKQNVFNPTSNVEQLKIVPISRAQAKQRAGRAGRVGPGGKCYHLYTQQQYDLEMAQSTIPEIQRTNLCNIVLTLKAVGIKDLFGFNFMDPPPKEILAAAMEKLYNLGALEGEDGILTPLGSRMSALPLDPSQSKTLLTAVDMDCAPAVLSVVSMLSSRNVFYRPRDKQVQADRAKMRFEQQEGDHMTLLTVYDEWLKSGKDEKWCRENFVNPRALMDAHETRAQLHDILSRRHDVGPDDPKKRDFVKVRKAITAGYFFQVAKRLPNGTYVTMSDRREVAIHPSSALFQKTPAFVVYNELKMTNQEYMRDVMIIERSWLREVAPTYFREAKAGEFTREQKAMRVDPIQRFGAKANDWRITKKPSGKKGR